MALARWIAELDTQTLPLDVSRSASDTIIDTVGLAFAARNADYVDALRRAWPTPGDCTVIGLPERLDAAAAATINGTAAHGEDFDNTFEGCPVHPGAVIVPAVFAIGEARGLCGSDVLRGIAVGQEVMCRIGMIARRGIHAAGFHPTAVAGALAATAAIAAALRVPEQVTVNALGIAGSLASGIIEYLADGSWTKRLHAGWAAQSGLRAVLMAEAGFTGPRTVFEGQHGFFKAFSPSIKADIELMTRDLGRTWLAKDVAFKPYASGTMTQPFIDCALALRNRGITADQIAGLHCFVGEGTVHRLWEPIDVKRGPPTAYAAKFSSPYCIAVGLLHGTAGLADFSDEDIADPAMLELMQRIDYEIDPDNEYPLNYTGHIRATLHDGGVVEVKQPHLRGGVHERLSRRELLEKCAANLAYGGADPGLAATIAAHADGIAEDGERFSLGYL
jgi:2-methylcitrate dehydratase PrpD